MRGATRTTRSSRDLIEESHVGVVQNTDVGYVVAQHRDARRSHPERPAGVAVGVETGRSEHRWVHHSRSENLHPPGALAAGAARAVTELALDIHFGRRLGEGEVAGTKARFRFSEEPVSEVGERRLEIDEADAVIDGESLYLRKHRSVRRVEEIPPVSVTGAQDSDRRLEVLHGADLHRRRVGAQ